jgi:glutamyl/glutaminyl-tRNA synthetase
MAPIRTRLAPTPSGRLHPGNAVSFIMTWALARATGGHILLRIDDLDKARRRVTFLDDIFTSLEWLGIDYDEGPSGVKDFLQHWSQHTRLDRYQAALDELRDGGHLFACTCSRRQIQERSPDGSYRGHCRLRGLDFMAPKTAWRIMVPNQTEISLRDWRWGTRSLNLSGYMGDFVVRQKNGLPAYQVASLVDDVDFGINFIVRGEDLLSSTAAQLFLARQLDRPVFTRSIFWHHRLWKNERGEKLSKSKGAGSLADWRTSGQPAAPLFQKAAEWLEIKQQVTTPTALIAALQRRGVAPIQAKPH